FFLPTTRTPMPTLFPYTTLFRSLGRCWKEPFFGPTLAPVLAQEFQQALREERVALAVALSAHVNEHALGVDIRRPQLAGFGDARSEEHTSELQSRGHLVCRLLLE